MDSGQQSSRLPADGAAEAGAAAADGGRAGEGSDRPSEKAQQDNEEEKGGVDLCRHVFTTCLLVELRAGKGSGWSVVGRCA